MPDKVKNKSFSIGMQELSLPLVIDAGYNSFIQGDPLRWHCHKGHELTFITRGSVVWEIEDSEPQILQSGQASHVMPGENHRGFYNITLPCEMFWIVFNPMTENAARMTPFSSQDLERIQGLFCKSGNCVVDMPAQAKQLMLEFKEICKRFHTAQDRNFLIPYTRAVLCQIIIQAASYFETQLQNEEPDEFSQVLKYVRENYNNQVYISDIAGIIGRKETYIFNLFKDKIGQTPNEYMIRLRMNLAAKLLKQSEKSITEIALDTGFSSSQYFSKVFAKYYGRSPGKFRLEK